MRLAVDQVERGEAAVARRVVVVAVDREDGELDVVVWVLEIDRAVPWRAAEAVV